MKETFIKFLEDDTAWDMFVTGPAGSGKTTNLKEAVQYCIDNNIPYVCTAYTKKACDVLRSKLPSGALVRTLHSWLKKRPGVNPEARKARHVQVSTKMGDSDRVRVLFVDERSVVGERDLMDIRSEQDNNYEGVPEIKVVWLGDSNQLPPVDDIEAVVPRGKYQVRLTKIYRTKNKLLEPLSDLVSFIEGTQEPHALEANEDFIRGVDLAKEYSSCKQDKILLAYTNKKVQALNSLIQGRETPEPGDTLFCPTIMQEVEFNGPATDVTYIDLPRDGELHLNSKYRTLEFLVESKLAEFGEFVLDGAVVTLAYVFGHENYRNLVTKLKKAAAKSNKDIEAKYPGHKPSTWAKINNTHPLARARAKAWREFLTFQDCVVCLDFNHAMTVHKSQGSTYHSVFVDMQDLAICPDYRLMLKLTYVAISRASHKVYTS